MRWEGNRESENVEDRRGDGGGGGGGFPIGGRGIGIGTVVLALIGWGCSASTHSPPSACSRVEARPRCSRRLHNAQLVMTKAQNLSLRFWPLPRMSGLKSSEKVALSINRPDSCCLPV